MSTGTSLPQPAPRWRFRSSLVLKQTAVVALIIVVTGGALILAAGTFGRRILRNEIDQRLMLAAGDRQALLLTYVRQQEERVALVASRTRLRQLLEDQAHGTLVPAEFQEQSRRILDDARRSAQGFLEIAIADPAGRVITSTQPSQLGKDYGAHPDFLEGRRHAHLGVPRHFGGIHQSFLTAPVVGSTGELEGVVIVALDAQAIVTLLTSQSGLGQSGEVLVGAREDAKIHLVLPARSSPTLTEIPLDRMTAMTLAIRGQAGLVRTQDFRGVDILAAYRPVGYRDWGLVVKIDTAEAYAPLARFQGFIIILEVATLLAGLVLSYLLARRFTQPILVLASKARTMATGNLPAHTGLARRTDEFGDLARTFDEMAEQIHRHIRRADALAEASQLFAQVTRDPAALLATVARRVAELVGDACVVFLVSDDGVWLEPVALHNVDPELLALSRSIFAAAPVRVEDSPVSGRVFETGEPILIADVAASSLHRTVRPEHWPLVERTASRGMLVVPLRAQGRSIGVLGLTRHRPESSAYDEEDLRFATALAERAALAIVNAELYRALEAAKEDLEQRVAERTAQLESANKELEAFSYSVAHDLRAPLRAIDGFSRLVVEDHAPHLPAEAQRYVRVVRENAQQMGRLIDDLLSFSRLSRQPLNKQRVRIADLAQQVADELQREHADRPVRIAIGDLPDCDADPGLLRQVFSNLLSNAIKFTRMREETIIEVESRTNGSDQIYLVRDNGVGFDMQYAGKLFGVFQRLHRAEEYEGTGVGLAIVQRIVHRHGGRVWAESEAGRGATFYFTLGGASHDGDAGRNPPGSDGEHRLHL